jgi:uncharacterized membrane protein
MSAQTGRPTVSPPPPSSKRLERARIHVHRLRDDPNPVWMRELKQAARLQRTPVILAVVSGMVTLLICSIGGIASVAGEPAKVGVALFHIFFSVAFFVVTWAGPAVAASTIAAERGGRTWEALLLTGLGAPAIARGKFLASLTYISLYIVMLAPVGALPFLFGGLTAIEVLLAFVLLFLFAVLSVAFGLSLSSKFASPVAAVTVTLLVTVPLSSTLYVVLGPLLAMVVHDLWPGVASAMPVWLPTAYVRADFGLEYLALLVLAPLAGIALPAWFLYEVTVANMGSVSDDRSSGLRRWLVVSVPVLTVVTLAPVLTARSWEWAIAGLAVLFLFLVFTVFVVAGEPLGPSRRVMVHWDRHRVSALKRYFGPGILRAASLLLVLGLTALVLATGLSMLVQPRSGAAATWLDLQRVGVFGGYAAAFFTFLLGMMAWTRTRSTGAAVPRLLLAAALFVACVGPWIVMAIGGVLSDSDPDARVLAAPSPLYVFQMMFELDALPERRDPVLLAGAACALGWFVLGLALLALAARRARRVVHSHDAALARVEEVLRAEDEGAAAAPAA